AGRSPIATHVVPVDEKPHYLARTWERVREEVASGRQVYIVCPRIGGGDDDAEADQPPVDDLAGDGGGHFRGPGGGAPHSPPPLAVIDVAAELSQGPLSDCKLAVLHGKLPSEEKEKIMLAFAAGQLDVLVTTTVIEVGVDVPNATTMVIMDADRFGV